MHSSMHWELAQQHGREQRLRATQTVHHRLPRSDRPTGWTRRPTGPARRLSVWFGYRMIGFGCRLARPALVPTTGAGA